MASYVHGQIEKFQQYIPLIQSLRNLGMRSRHWTLLSERLNMNLMSNSTLTLSHCLELGLLQYIDEIAIVAEVAGKEYTIEQVCRKVCDLSGKCLDKCLYNENIVV